MLDEPESIHPEDAEEAERIKKLAEQGIYLVGGSFSFNFTVWTSPEDIVEMTFGRSQEATPLSEKECIPEAKRIAEIVKEENIPLPDDRETRFINLMEESGFSWYGFRRINAKDAVKLFKDDTPPE